jgi:hypothetical protein
MSGTMGRRSGLASVEARAQPAYRSPIARNRGTTWSFPGFGRDPEITPFRAAPPPPVAPVAPVAPTSPPVVVPTTVAAPAAASDGGNQNQESPGDGGGNGGGFNDPASQQALADMNTAIAGGVGPESPAWSSPGVPDATAEVNASIAAGYGPESGGWGGPSGGFNDPASQQAVADMNNAISAGFGPESGGWGGPSDPGAPGPGEPGGAFGAPDGVGEGWGDPGDFGGSGGDFGGDPGGGDGGGGGHSGGGDGQGGEGGDAGGDGQGWMVGGYTGAGEDGIVDPTQPAGTVHEGEVVIPAHQVAQHGLDPLMALAGPGAKMGAMPALGMVQAQGGGLPPQGDFSVPPFQSPSHGNGASPPPYMAGSPMAPASEIDGAGMDMDEPFDMAQPSDDFMHGMGPYAKEADYADPFKAPDPSKGATGSTATSAIGQLTPDAQAAVLQALGSDPMAASALLQVLGPSFRDLIAQALKANAPPQPMAGAGGMMGAAPGMMG